MGVEAFVGDRARTPGRTRALWAALLLVFSVVPFLGAVSGASAAPTAPARSAQSDVAGFPLWYQDANGVRVQPCFDPNDANCPAPISATYDPTKPLAFPGNYPDEFFYSAVDSQPVIVPDCAANPVANPGLTVHLALEGAFLNGTLTPGDQMVFGRIRITAKAGSGLCANSYYTVRTPYGPVTVQTDAAGNIAGGVAAAKTIDVGCLPGPTKPCDFNAVLAARHLSVGLLHQVNNAALGYLGSGIGFDAITGGMNGFNSVEIYKWPAGAAPATGLDQDCVDCTLVGSTDQFSVSAKLAGPLTSSVNTLGFGGVALATSKTATLTLSNAGSGPLGLDPTTIDSITVSGPNAGDFTPTVTSCPVIALNAAAGQIARDATCDVTVQFTAGSTTKESATLDISLNGGTQALHIPLVATGLVAGAAPAMTVDPADGNLALGAVRITTVSAIKTVTVTNSGSAPLLVTPTIVPSADSAAFAVVTNTCAAGYVDPAASCAIGLQFTPGAVKTYAAVLDLANNAGATFAVALTGNGTGGNAAVGPVNPVNTQPEWYQDEFGTRVGQCDDPSNPLCITAIPSGTAVFPTNYPSEWFYYIAQSTPIDVSDPACGLVGRQMFVTAAVESAFLGAIAPNQGTTFGRLRIVSHGGLCPNTEYLITHPYGQIILATDGLGNIKPKAGTTDVGCVGAPCDFTIALSAPEFEHFLQQTVHPAGYLGDPLAPSTVSGAPFTDPVTNAPANLFRVQTVSNGVGGATLASTDQFTVSGRLVGPMVATPAATNFGSAEVNVGSATATTTFTNQGLGTVTLKTPAVTITGAAAADYSVAAATCTDGLALAPGASCTVDVTFAPKATGARTAALELHHDGQNDPLAASLTGIGTSANGTAAISSSLASVQFTDQHIGTASASEYLTISNVGGSADLLVSGATITAGAPFTITSNTCQSAGVAVAVLPNATCTIGVHFSPTVVATSTANLTITSNAVAGTLTVALKGTSVNLNPAQSATTTAAGFPTWFQDSNGLRLEQCLAQDQNCVLLQDPGFNPANPIAWPSNYPMESFYGLADSQIMTVEPQVCATGEVTAGGLAQTRLATEATFAGVTQATAGAQAWFNRIRVTASGLCPSTTYSFVTPYGIVSVTTDGAGSVKAKAGTFDNTNILGSAPVNPAVLVWDPNYATAPAGYIGDARTYQKVVGGRFSLTPGGEPVNFFRIVGPNGTVGQVDKFIVAGRVAGPVTATPTFKDFGSLLIGSTLSQSFTISNITNAPIAGFTAVSDNQAFVVSSNNCPAGTATLAANSSCTVQVQFKPTTALGAGLKTGTVSVGYNGLRAPLKIALTGTAVAPASNAITVSPTSLAFGNVNVNSTSVAQSVSIKNSGSGPLVLTGTPAGTNPGQYSVTATTCPSTGLAAGGTCTISVVFKPTSTGSKPATLAITGTAPGSTTVVVTSNVTLSGTGAQGTISVAGTLSITGQAGRTNTGKLTLSNTGTAPFSLTGAPFYTFTAISGNNPVPMYSASQTGCNNVAPGKNCTVTVSFAVPTGTPAGTYSVQLSMTSNASNNPVKVTVNGTVK